MTTKNSKMIHIRVPANWPLDSKECGTVLRQVIPLFHAVNDGDVETFFKYHPEVEAILNKLNALDAKAQTNGDETDELPETD